MRDVRRRGAHRRPLPPLKGCSRPGGLRTRPPQPQLFSCPFYHAGAAPTPTRCRSSSSTRSRSSARTRCAWPGERPWAERVGAGRPGGVGRGSGRPGGGKGGCGQQPCNYSRPAACSAPSEPHVPAAVVPEHEPLGAADRAGRGQVCGLAAGARAGERLGDPRRLDAAHARRHPSRRASRARQGGRQVHLHGDAHRHPRRAADLGPARGAARARKGGRAQPHRGHRRPQVARRARPHLPPLLPRQLGAARRVALRLRQHPRRLRGVDLLRLHAAGKPPRLTACSPTHPLACSPVHPLACTPVSTCLVLPPQEKNQIQRMREMPGIYQKLAQSIAPQVHAPRRAPLSPAPTPSPQPPSP